MEIGAKIKNGKIIVIDGENDEIITIKANEHIKLFINDEACEEAKDYNVRSNDNIKYICEKTEGSRKAEVRVTEDKMKAYIKITYTPEVKYKLKDKQSFLNLALTAEEEYRKEPQHYTVEELKKILFTNNVTYGIINENLEVAKDSTGTEFLIAEGLEPVKNKPSDVKLFFSPTQMVFPSEDSDEKIDYKNLFRISNVNEGDKIAEIIPEVPGKDGVNVFGKIIKREYVRSLPINATKGCKIEENDIIATLNGKAHIANRNITVNPVYSVEKVNMETCNIKFYGDIEVYDSVDDNMTVKSGGSLDVSQNVNTSNVVSGGEITIIGNAINSQILSGQIDIRKKEYCDSLRELKKMIEDILEVVNTISSQLISFDFNELLKTLLEGRFKEFPKKCLNIITLNLKNNSKNSKLIDYIKENFLGYNILNVTGVQSLNTLAEIVENEIEFYDKNIIVPLDIRLSYCQDCEIKSTGNIVLNGQGEYTSNLTAMKDILFTNKNSVARGGKLCAGNVISAGIVGSPANIVTMLVVPLYGKITATYAYKNTIFRFGNLTKILEDDARNINVTYDDKVKEIIILHSGL